MIAHPVRRPPVRAVLVAALLAAGCYTGSARDVSPDGIRAEAGWLRVQGVPFVHQRRDDDCGAAALAMALRYLEIDATEAQILAEAPPRDGGITAGALRDAARRRGLQAFVIPGSWDDLEAQLGRGRPVVVGLLKPIFGRRAVAHFEVVVGFNRSRRLILSLDPARGLRENSAEDFAREWVPAGRVMLVVFPSAQGTRYDGRLVTDAVTDFDHRETRSHYEALLARVYTWMLGDLDAARARAQAELSRLGIGPVQGLRALDLGAGIGLHASALADLGYQVTALDSSEQLLGELARARPDVATVHGDITAARKLVAGPFALIVCMGDTLPHLASPKAVWAAMTAARALLTAAGRVVLSFRDYTRARAGADRCFLVRADADRILTCCLTYEQNRVEVTDILHERVGGAWQMRAGAYHKLRISIPWLTGELAAAGLTVTHSDENAGWLTVVAARA